MQWSCHTTNLSPTAARTTCKQHAHRTATCCCASRVPTHPPAARPFADEHEPVPDSSTARHSEHSKCSAAPPMPPKRTAHVSSKVPHSQDTFSHTLQGNCTQECAGLTHARLWCIIPASTKATQAQTTRTRQARGRGRCLIRDGKASPQFLHPAERRHNPSADQGLL